MGTVKYWPCDQILRDNTADTAGTADSWAGSLQQANPGDITISTLHSPMSGSCLRVFCDKDFMYNGVHRSENRSHYDNSYEGAIGFRVFFPFDYADDPETEVLHQLHEIGGSPVISFQSRNGELFFENKYGSFSNNSFNEHTLGTIVKGQWINIVYKYKIAQAGLGYLKIWRDGNQLIDHTGTIGYSDSVEPPYKKFGIYKWRWTSSGNNSNTTERTVFYDEIRYASGNMDFALVDPAPALEITETHVSNIGNDETGDGSELNPIKTISKLNEKTAAGLNAGEKIFFKAGDSFKDTLLLPTVNDGVGGNPVVTSKYDAGEKPIISGLKEVTNWIPSGANIYEAYDVNFPNYIFGLLIDEVFKPKGKLPSEGKLNYQSGTTTSLTSDEIPTIDYSGGEVEAVIDKEQWVQDTVVISGRSGNTLTYSGGSNYPGRSNFTFFIQNAIECLTSEGDWLYSPLDKKLYIFSSVDPNGLNITIANDQYNISIDSAQWNAINNLKLEGAWETGLRDHVGSNFRLENSDIINQALDGAILLSAVNAFIENNLFENCLSNALVLRNESTGASVKRNTFRNIGLIPGAAGNGDAKGSAVHCSSEGLICELNRFENIGYLPVQFFGSNSAVTKNFIDGFCFTKHDGGGIYCYGAGKDSSTFVNRTVLYNIIKNGGVSVRDAVHGMYFDDNSEGIVANYNTVIACMAAALYIHNSHGISTNYNIFFGCGIGFLFGQNKVGGVDNELIRDNEFKNNVVVVLSKNHLLAELSTEGNDIALFGEFDLNTYIVVSGQQAVFFTKHFEGAKLFYNCLTFAQWQAMGHDLNSTVKYLNVPEYVINSEQANRHEGNVGVFYQEGSAAVSIDADLYPGAIKSVVTSQSPVTTRVEVHFSNLGAVSSTKDYLIRFKAAAPSGHQSLIIYARQSPSPYRRLSREIYAIVTSELQQFEFLLSDIISDTQIGILIEHQSHQGDLYIDDFEFREVSVTKTNYEEEIQVIYNDTEAINTIELTGNWKNLDDAEITNIELGSFESEVIIKSSVEPDPDPIEYDITLVESIGGSVSIITVGPYTEEKTIEVAATSNEDYAFKHWLLNGEIVGIGISNYSFSMPGTDTSIQPVFEIIEDPDPEPEPDPSDYFTVRGIRLKII